MWLSNIIYDNYIGSSIAIHDECMVEFGGFAMVGWVGMMSLYGYHVGSRMIMNYLQIVA